MAGKELGIKKETAGALTYMLGPITGIFFLVINKDPFVRFHAAQSTLVFGILLILRWATILLFPLPMVINTIAFILWLILIYKAWQGEKWEVPFIGKISRNLLAKLSK